MKEYKLEILRQPIKAHEIEWRVSSTNVNTGKYQVVPYINARCVMERFDEAFGVLDWSTEFKELNGGFLCRITLSNGTFKEDGASNTDIEPHKGGISDALKRAAHQFGLGRNLYEYPKVFVQGKVGEKPKFIPSKVQKRLEDLVNHINKSGGVYKEGEVVVLNES